MINKPSKGIIWDFDGTIYQSPDSYMEYARCVAEKIGKDGDDFISKVEMAMAGKSSYVADDGWAIVANMSREYTTKDKLDECFVRTREKMNRGEISMVLSEAALKVLRDRRAFHILITNTPEPFAIPLLNSFNITPYFDRVIFGAGKPDGMMKNIIEILDSKSIEPQQILSIGDNYINDIFPSIQMGLNTIYIKNYPRDSDADITVRSLDDAMGFIEEFLKS